MSKVPWLRSGGTRFEPQEPGPRAGPSAAQRSPLESCGVCPCASRRAGDSASPCGYDLLSGPILLHWNSPAARQQVKPHKWRVGGVDSPLIPYHTSPLHTHTYSTPPGEHGCLTLSLTCCVTFPSPPGTSVCLSTAWALLGLAPLLPGFCWSSPTSNRCCPPRDTTQDPLLVHLPLPGPPTSLPPYCPVSAYLPACLPIKPQLPQSLKASPRSCQPAM